VEDDMTKFRAAYQAWLRAREQFDEEIKKLLSGDTTANDRRESVLNTLDRTYKDFREAAKPFVKSGPKRVCRAWHRTIGVKVPEPGKGGAEG